jgi:hypothetical protein
VRYVAMNMGDEGRAAELEMVPIREVRIGFASRQALQQQSGRLPQQLERISF